MEIYKSMSKYTDELRKVVNKIQAIRDAQLVTDAADRIDAMESVLGRIGEHFGVQPGDVQALFDEIEAATPEDIQRP